MQTTNSKCLDKNVSMKKCLNFAAKEAFSLAEIREKIDCLSACIFVCGEIRGK